jgi:predicted N-acyltransferase
MEIRIHSRLEEIPAGEWNALVRESNPLLRHEFLCAMERHRCVGEEFGWLPCHLAVYEGGRLVGAMPLYEKHNSYGEFVFDHAWADAYRRGGIPYYPKLVSAVPYTPAAGQRMLSAASREGQVFPLLMETVRALSERIRSSGIHVLFPEQAELDFLSRQGWLGRHDCQFHWHNRNYADFDDFLRSLTARKRKNIRQERQRVVKSGVRLRRLDGNSATAEDWRHFTRFYNQTFMEKWGMATFNFGFFSEVAEKLPGQVLLVLADQGRECIAGALMFSSDTTLYGRHWGCDRTIDSLHFEACYYQGIEYCIERGLQRFEPGAQGEHKIARGFLPRLTSSRHWIGELGFREPIARYVAHEKEAVEEYIELMNGRSPYRHELEKA